VTEPTTDERARAGRQLAELCARLFGVRPPSEAALVEHAERRAARLAKALPDYVASLPLDDRERGALATFATNGWTWFWREADALTAACERLAARRWDRPAHAWVAGCSTGEEAFTVAMIAAERGLDLRVLGTDVDPARIDHARAAIYEPPALRHLTPERAARFEPTGDGRLRPPARIRQRVRFSVHNLLSSPLRPPTGEWDLISCRNVLLHSHEGAASGILSRLGSVLDPLGARVLSAVDELAVDAGRLARSTPAPALRAPAPRIPAAPAPVDRASEAEREIGRGNALLAAHRLDEAAEAYRAALVIEPGCAEALLMQGLLHRKAGAPERAEDALRRALFLEPDLWLGWMHLAGIYERLGLPERSERALVAALSSLQRRPRLRWRAPDGGLRDRRIDAEAARRWCRARLRARPTKGERT